MSQHIYRYKKDEQLYTIEHLILDTRYLNYNAFRGIYAYPYKRKGKILRYTYDQVSFQGKGKTFDPLKFVKDNFEIVAELL